VVNLEALAPDERDGELRLWCAGMACAPFDLERDPVFRCVVLRQRRDLNVLVFVVHHIAFDGWSGAVFTAELGTLYRAAFRERRRSPLPELALRYPPPSEDAGARFGSRNQ